MQSILGYSRRAFICDEIIAMQDAGVISEDERFELIEGKVVPKAPKISAQERFASLIGMDIARACPPELIVGFKSSLFLSRDTFVEPDISLYPERLRSQEVRGADILLAIEVAASSLEYDLKLKARLYARHGVRELWVVDVNERVTWVHTQSGEHGWSLLARKGEDEVLTCAALPDFRFKLAEA